MVSCHAGLTQLGNSSVNIRGYLLFLFRFTTLESDVNCSQKNEQELLFSKHSCGSSVCTIYLGYKKRSFRFPHSLQGFEVLQRYIFCWQWSVWWWYAKNFRNWMNKWISQCVQSKCLAELPLQLYGIPGWNWLVLEEGGIHLNPFRLTRAKFP